MSEMPAVPESPAAPIEFESTVTEAGYRRVLIRVALRRLRWVLPFLAFFGFAALGRGDTDIAWLWLVMSAGTMLIVVAYALWVTGSPSASKAAMVRVRYRADGEGLRYESADGSGLIEWDRLRRWEVAADHYLLYVGAATYLLVPVSDLDVVEARGPFESLLRAHVISQRSWHRLV